MYTCTDKTCIAICAYVDVLVLGRPSTTAGAHGNFLVYVQGFQVDMLEKPLLLHGINALLSSSCGKICIENFYSKGQAQLVLFYNLFCQVY